MLQMMAEGGGRTGQRRRRCRLIQVASESRCLWMWLLMAFSQKKHNGLVAVMGFPPCYKQIISTTATASFPGTTTTRSSGIRLFLSSEQENPSPKKSRFSNKKSNKPYNFWEEKLSITAFNMDLHNLAMEDAEKAQDALEIMEGLYSQEPDNPHYVQPDSASYTTVIEGWCYGNHYEDAPQRSQALLDIMESKPHLAPNELTYLLVCQKWAESYKADVAGANAQKAHAILLGLKLKNKNPSTKLYSIVLEGWCRRVGKVPRAMNRAEELLCEMEESGGVSRPNVLTYTSVIGGLARSNEHDLATRADAMLKRMQQNGVESDMVAYTSVLNCWGKAVSRVECEQASSRALEILKTMEDSYTKEENYHVKPNAITYATAIKAIGNSLNPEAHILAENILRHMYNLTETGTIHVPPSVGTYNAVITSLSTRCPKSNRLSNARRAEHLLVDMIKRTRNGESLVEPNVRTWGAVLRAWADSGQPDSGEQAQRVLDLLEQWYEEGKTAVRPNVVCYTTVMSAWGRGNASPKIALDNVERILKKMETIYEETLDLDVRPNKITYVTAIDVFTRKCKNNSASRAQGVVERMMQLYSKGVGFDRPTRIIFNALVNAWSRSNEENAAANAEKIFRWMESQYRSGDNFVKPDEVTLSGVLNAWANNAQDGGALRAQQIMDRTESRSIEERGFAHSIVCYNILIKAWGRSRAPDSVQRAEEILIRLEDRYRNNKDNIRPDVTTYSSVINCCAYYSGKNEGRRETFEVALRTFRKLQETNEGPNNISYGTLFKAIAKLTVMDEARDAMIEDFFHQCCEEGFVDAFVISQVKAASLTNLYQKLLSPCSMKRRDLNDVDKVVAKIPQDWGKNVIDF